MRPSLKNQKPFYRLKEEETPVDNILKAFNQMPDFARELETLKRKYQQKIEELDQTTELTKQEVREELATLIRKFKEDAVKLFRDFNASSDSVLAQFQIQFQRELSNTTEKLNQKVMEAESAVKNAESIAMGIKKGNKGDKGDSVKGEPGYTPLKGKDYFDGKDAVLTKEMLIDFIKNFDGILEIKDVKNLEERLRNIGSKVMLGGGQGSWKQKNLSGTINGINTVFTFTGDPFAEFSETIYLNYIAQNPFTDYTINGNTITYTTAPDASLSGLPHIIRGM